MLIRFKIVKLESQIREVRFFADKILTPVIQYLLYSLGLKYVILSQKGTKHHYQSFFAQFMKNALFFLQNTHYF